MIWIVSSMICYFWQGQQRKSQDRCIAQMVRLEGRQILSRNTFDQIFMQSIPAAPNHNPPPVKPQALAFFFPWLANSWGWGLLNCQIPRGGDEKRGQMPRPPSTLQYFSLIAQSNNAVLSILICDFLFQLTSSFVIALGF